MKDYFKYIQFIIIIILSIFIIRLFSVNKDLKKSLPYLIKGEKISYFNIIDKDGKELNEEILNSSIPSLIFIFSRPCSPCNKNIIYWKNMAEILKGKVNIYGIILNSATEAHNFREKAKLNFSIFIPENINEFIKSFRIKLNLAETIIYKNGMEYTSMGNLTGDEAVKIINMVKGISK